MANVANTKIRAVRIADPLWESAQEITETQGDNIPDVIRLALAAYVVDPTATMVALTQIRGSK